MIIAPLINIIQIILWILQLGIYKNLGKYYDTKEFILNKDTILQQIIEIDKKHTTINPSIVMAFVSILSDINTAYKHILTSLSVSHK